MVSNLLTILAEGRRALERPAVSYAQLLATTRREVTADESTADVHTAPAAPTSDDAADLFARASAFHRAGDLAQAQAGYIAVLQTTS